MAFPNNPSNGDTFVRYGRTYQYDSAMLMWKVPKSGILLGELADIDITTNPPIAGEALLWSGSTFEPGAVGAVTVYQTDLPLTGNSAGDMAYITDLSSLYIFTGSGAGGGWFNIGLINESPTITTGPDATYLLSLDGTPTVITLVANDPEGLPITWSYAVTTGSLGTTATVSQTDNVFTITPSSTEVDAGNFGITFTASDGVNLATAASTFTLVFSYVTYNSTKNVSTTDVGLSTPLTVWFDVADEYDINITQNIVVDIDIWGAGGGGSSQWSGGNNNAGAGGYSYARGVQLPLGAYKIVVGAGGLGSILNNAETQVTMDALNEDFGNGGLGSQGNYSGAGYNNGGCGGGFSGLFSSTVTFETPLFMSGGGGGAGTSSFTTFGGGQGGGSTGAAGGGSLNPGPGTQSGGGVGVGYAGAQLGGSGSQLQGGDGSGAGGSGFGGGGGGGGYYGGGSAGTAGNGGTGGGGGGSGYITGALTMTSSGAETATVKRIPTTAATGAPNNTSPGVGGFTSSSRPAVNGFDGAVKITITGTY
jgi:hypothetical protein